MSALQQAMQELKAKLPIERARMRLRVQLPASCREELMAILTQKQATVESQDLGLQTNQVPRPAPCDSLKCMPWIESHHVCSPLASPLMIHFAW